MTKQTTQEIKNIIGRKFFGYLIVFVVMSIIFNQLVSIHALAMCTKYICKSAPFTSFLFSNIWAGLFTLGLYLSREK